MAIWDFQLAQTSWAVTSAKAVGAVNSAARQTLAPNLLVFMVGILSQTTLEKYFAIKVSWQ
jgi:hypothetical protein